MSFIYLIGLHLYRSLIFIVSPFNKKANKWLKGRRKIIEHIGKQLCEGERRIWIHAASLGEFEQGRPLIEKIKKEQPELKIVLTFFSPSGYEIRKDYKHADYIFYLPLDTKSNARKFVKIIQPEIAVFVKYEFWRNYLSVLKKKSIPTYLVSTIFRKDQAFFKWYGGWYKKMLYCFEHFFVQNNESKQILNNAGFENVTLSGDTRLDRVYDIAMQAESFPIVEQFVQDKPVLILGSSWKPDEEFLFDYINNKTPLVKCIIAPHEIQESNIERIIANVKCSVSRYSQVNNGDVANSGVLIIDNIGMLASVYKYGNVACIGGGFGSGIHSILEAATFGLPVLFGPNYKKFKEAFDLIELGGAYEYTNQETVQGILEKLFTNEVFYNKASQACKQYVKKKKGATEKIYLGLFA